MVTIIAFDTLAYSRTLEDAGFRREQAEAIAKAQQTAFGQILDAKELATKGDIAELRASIQQDIAELRATTQQDIAELRTTTQQDIAELRTTTQQDIAELRATTQQDIAELRSSMQQEIAALRTTTQKDIAELHIELQTVKSDLVRWMIGLVAGLGAFLVAVMAWLK